MDRFVKYGINVFGIDPSLDQQTIAEKAIDETYAFFASIGIPMHLKDLGIDESRVQEMAKHIAETSSLENAYVPLSEKDIADIITASL
jgi:alcohol dehydrogenase YqhD (iron-dependent ADH family)